MSIGLMSSARFDPTINMGTVIQTITLLLALWGVASRLEARLTILETEINPLWQDYIHSKGR